MSNTATHTHTNIHRTCTDLHPCWQAGDAGDDDDDDNDETWDLMYAGDRYAHFYALHCQKYTLVINSGWLTNKYG